MSDIFSLTTRPNRDLFFTNDDRNDPRMGSVVATAPSDYAAAEIVILGCPQDEGIRRAKGRPGAASAPDAIREQFYQLSTLNIKKRVFDLGDTQIGETLEATHRDHAAVLEAVLRDGKRLIVLGGGNDIAYPAGVAMSAIYHPEWWIGVHVDSRLDVRIAKERNAGTQYRQLLDERLLLPENFFEVGFQSHFCSPAYYNYIRDLGVHRISLELLRSRADVDRELKDAIRLEFIKHSASVNTYFGFDMGAVRSADAPGTTSPSPLGLRAGEFITLVKYAASLANTRMIEFSEANPDYDQDHRTMKLVAIAMHRFCSGVQ